MKQQTAVEWLVNQVEDFIGLIPVDIIDKAKAMDKQQKIEDYRSGRVDQQSRSSSKAYHRTAEQYYNETYGPK